MTELHLQSAWIRDAARGQWLRFHRPLRMHVARTLPEVVPVLEALDTALEAGRWVCGYLGYEAGPAMDDALSAHPSSGEPLAVFAEFDEPEVVEEPPFPRHWITARGNPPPELAFREGVQAIRESIARGDVYQTNLTYPIEVPWRASPQALFAQLVHAQNATYGALLDLGDVVVSSASPELFFSVDAGRIISRPMKGTRPRSAPVAELLGSDKERAENLMIVDMVRNDLSRVCRPGSVDVPDLFTPEAYPTVWQLTSTVVGETREPLSRVMRALFPAASITGAPKSTATRIIRNLESGPRGVYTGTIGFASPDGRAQFNVAIRTAVVDPDGGRARFGVGGGIVWDSSPQAEFEETRTKAAVLSYTPPEFSLLETMLCRDGEVVLLKEHLERMHAGASFFGFVFDGHAARARVEAAAPAEGGWRMRLLSDRSGILTLNVWPLRETAWSSNPRLVVGGPRVSSADVFLRHKTTHRQIYADMLAAHPDADDVILLNEHGEVTETCFGNLFLDRDGVLLTPPASAGLLPGTLRAQLIRQGRAVERSLRPDELTASRTLIGNSVRGLYRPREIGRLS
ncbi:MAG: chorismate-binding protein [Rhodothermales bacterium]|nr:chorismate-binding protein [Rhodothermales bacterium]MBO6781142.1 chorismate-binding protein [Rhodothermales bacterium]